ncbi:MAG: hypothetical protein HY842_12755 [Bacteroidetes bacterium]|nr:hypothetical protein [Bacteroidota bacterium]
MTILTVFVVLLSIIIILRYFSHYKKGERTNFSNLATLIQTIFVFVTLWITIWTISSSNQTTVDTLNELKSISSSSSAVNDGLEGVSEKLKEIPRELEQFSITLNSLDKSLVSQQGQVKDNIKRLKNNIDGLNKSVQQYQMFINNYSGQLEKIVNRTDEQLAIWKDQQKILLEEFSRKPDMTFDISKCQKIGDTLKINELAISNNGNIMAEVIAIKLEIPTEILDTFSIEGWELFSKYNGNTNYITTWPFNSVPNHPGIVKPNEFRLVFPKSSMPRTYPIVYKITYQSKYLDAVKPGLLTDINCK